MTWPVNLDSRLSLLPPPLVVEGGETGIEVGDLYNTIKYDVKYMT